MKNFLSLYMTYRFNSDFSFESLISTLPIAMPSSANLDLLSRPYVYIHLVVPHHLPLLSQATRVVLIGYQVSHDTDLGATMAILEVRNGTNKGHYMQFFQYL